MPLFLTFVAVGVLFGASFVSAPHASAARLYLAAPREAVHEGQNIMLEVRLDTQGAYVNAGEVKLAYPKHIFSGAEASDGGSLFNLFLVPPSFDEQSGNLVFEGGMTPPFFSGDGLLARAFFRAEQRGVAQFVFDESSRMISADGRGTPLPLVLETILVRVVDELPLSPRVSSTTHPDEAMFYALDQAVLEWERELGNRYSYVLAKGEPEEPDSVPEEDASSVLFHDLADGIYWFGIRAIDVHGDVGPTVFFRLMVDTTPPFGVRASVAGREEGDLLVAIAGSDNLSGIDYYEVAFPGGDVERVVSPIVRLSQAGAITVKVFDKAGNVFSREVSVGGDAEKQFIALGIGIVLAFALLYLLWRHTHDKKEIPMQ